MKTSNTFVYSLYGNLYINLTNKCTNNCTFCIRNGRDGMQNNTLWLNKDATFEEVKAQLPHGFEDFAQIVFCGFGEPTCNLSTLLAVAAYLKTRTNKPIRLDTNGHANAYNQCDVAPLLKGCVDVVSISLNASTKQKYQTDCQSMYGEKGFQIMLDFVSQCKAQGIEIVLSIVDIVGKDEIEKCRALASSMHCPLKVRVYE